MLHPGCSFDIYCKLQAAKEHNRTNFLFFGFLEGHPCHLQKSKRGELKMQIEEWNISDYIWHQIAISPSTES